mgnify:CR=1 FL=1
MKQSIFTVSEIRQLTADTYAVSLDGDTEAITAPGQFVDIALPQKYLRRPISVGDWSLGHLLLLVKEIGPVSWFTCPKEPSWISFPAWEMGLIWMTVDRRRFLWEEGSGSPHSMAWPGA